MCVLTFTIFIYFLTIYYNNSCFKLMCNKPNGMLLSRLSLYIVSNGKISRVKTTPQTGVLSINFCLNRKVAAKRKAFLDIQVFKV